METAKRSLVHPVLPPAVDLNVPAKVETATFALG